MNATPLEQLLLLEQSGELSAQQRLRLDAELAASAEARRLRAELRGLAAAVPPPPAGPRTAMCGVVLPCWYPHSLPVRPNPVRVSSATT